MKNLLILFLVSTSLFAQSNFRMRAPKLAQINNSQFSANDVNAEIEFGKGLAARILNTHPLVDNYILQKYVNTLGAGLASQIGRPELTFYFGVIDTADVNAYACPGGYIFLTKGLIDMLSNEAELVGVLAHEIAHVNERHVIKKLKIKGKGGSAIDGLGAMIGGATASFRVAVQTITQEAMNLLFNEGLSASEELQSDRQAIRAVQATGYQVSTYRDLLLKLKKNIEASNAKVLSKTHPKVDERLKLMDQFEIKNPAVNTKTNEERFKRYAKL